MGHPPTETSLLEANARFYKVFEELEYPAMEALWERGDRAFCVHPGWPPLQGSVAILDSWKRIIGNTASMRFDLTRVEAWVDGAVGIVTVVESISTEVEGQRHSSGVVSTNLFSWNGSEWKIFHHHAAHCPLPPVDESGVLN